MRPDTIAIFRSEANARLIVQPRPSLSRLFLWNFQSLPIPKPFNASVADRPSGVSQHDGNPTIAVSAILSGKFDHVGNQPPLVRPAAWHTSLCRSMPAQDAAGPAFRNSHLVADKVEAPAAAMAVFTGFAFACFVYLPQLNGVRGALFFALAAWSMAREQPASG